LFHGDVHDTLTTCYNNNPSFASLRYDHGDHVTCILDNNNSVGDLDSLPMTSCCAGIDHIINSINIHNNDDVGIVTPPFVSGDQVTNGNDRECDSFVEDRDHTYMSLPSINPFPCFACVAQGFAVREPSLLKNNLSGLVQEASLLQNDPSGPQTCLPLVSVTMPKKIGAKRRRCKSSAMPVDSDPEVLLTSYSGVSSSSKDSKIGSPKPGDHVTEESKPVLSKPEAVNAIGGHITEERGFDSGTPLVGSPFLYQVIATFVTDGFYQDRGSHEAIGRSLSMLKEKGVFGSQLPDYLNSHDPLRRIKCRLSSEIGNRSKTSRLGLGVSKKLCTSGI
jgi:hypothetical protein